MIVLPWKGGEGKAFGMLPNAENRLLARQEAIAVGIDPVALVNLHRIRPPTITVCPRERRTFFLSPFAYYAQGKEVSRR